MMLSKYISFVERDILAGGGERETIAYPHTNSDYVTIERCPSKYEIIFGDRNSKLNESLEQEIRNVMYNGLLFENIIVDRPRKIAVLIPHEDFRHEQFIIDVRYYNCVFTENLSASALMSSELIRDCCVGNYYDI